MDDQPNFQSCITRKNLLLLPYFAQLELELRNQQPIMDHIAQIKFFLLDEFSQLGPACLRKHNADEEVAIVSEKEGESLVDLKAYLGVFAFQLDDVGQLIVHPITLC